MQEEKEEDPMAWAGGLIAALSIHPPVLSRGRGIQRKLPRQ